MKLKVQCHEIIHKKNMKRKIHKIESKYTTIKLATNHY